MAMYIKLMHMIFKILFKRSEYYFFPFYMFVLYRIIIKQQKKYKIVPVPYKLFSLYLHRKNTPCSDLNNCIIIRDAHIVPISCIELYSQNCETRRYAFCASWPNKDDVIYVTDYLYNNIKRKEEWFQIRKVSIKSVSIAVAIDISLVNSSKDVSNAAVDYLLRNYFKTLKLISKNDVVAINVKDYGAEYFFTNSKVNVTEVVYFRCNKVFHKNNRCMSNDVFFVNGQTTLKLSPNVQCFAPVQNNLVKKQCFDGNLSNCLVKNCPYGLQQYCQQIKHSVQRFLNKKRIPVVFPSFLITGKNGVGIEIIVKSLSCQLGLHLYKTSSTDLTANVYSQTESKIRNVFFKAKTAAPCILLINHFQNFGKNNEGIFDKRIMKFFKLELISLLNNQKYPIILMCVSENRIIPAQLLRIFLETFEISVHSQQERKLNLEWILELNNVFHNINTESLATKTHGFLFEELKLLLLHAESNSKENHMLTDSVIDETLKLIQKNCGKQMGTPEIPTVEWSDIGGLGEVKSEIIKTINLPLKFSKLFRNSSYTRSGMLLYGPPGTGKTLLAKAVANECQLCFLSVKGPELLNMYVGQSERNIREVFEKAREASPCIIFFDELDSLAPKRGNSGDSGGVMDRIVSQLLAEMDGLDQGKFVFVIGATNRPDMLDLALLRPGRFDKLLYVGPCTNEDSKLSVLTALTKRFNFSSPVNLKEVLKMFPQNITGADLYGFILAAWMSSTRKLILKKQKDDPRFLRQLTAEEVVVSTDDIKKAVSSIKPCLKKEDLLYYDQLKKQFT